MAVGLILTFTGNGRADYDAVNAKLGIDTTKPNADWPAGLRYHAAGTTEDGNLVVTEVWDSREAQGRFIQERLGPALGAAGVSGQPQMTWFDVIAFSVPETAAAR